MSDQLIRPEDQPSSLFATLRALTPARVGLGRTGVSQRVADVLSFQHAHAQARDAVHARLDTNAMASTLSQVQGVAQRGPVLRLHSAAPDRPTYLQRPDLGRILDQTSRNVLADLRFSRCDLALVVADGLSALAVERNAVPLTEALLPLIPDLGMAPISVVEQGRVAIADEIGVLLQAEIAVILIGERPGLSSPDSVGAYITWEPRPGRTDADRNCISNIRSEGLSFHEAAVQIAACIRKARLCRLTGVALGDAAPMLPASEDASEGTR